MAPVITRPGYQIVPQHDEEDIINQIKVTKKASTFNPADNFDTNSISSIGDIEAIPSDVDISLSSPIVASSGTRGRKNSLTMGSPKVRLVSPVGKTNTINFGDFSDNMKPSNKSTKRLASQSKILISEGNHRASNSNSNSVTFANMNAQNYDIGKNKDVKKGFQSQGTTLSQADPTDPRALMAHFINDLGLGKAQIFVAILAGGVFFADGAELLLLGAINEAVCDEFQIEKGNMFRYLTVSMVFIGVMFGNILGGYADGIGRKIPILVGYFFIFAVSIISGVTQSFGAFVFFRFIAGIAFAFGQPAVQALNAEIYPTKARVAYQSVIGTMFALGEMYIAAVIMYIESTRVPTPGESGTDATDAMYKENWRMLTIVGAVPALVLMILCYMYLIDSPNWYLKEGTLISIIIETMYN